jgi:hypothetical protein
MNLTYEPEVIPYYALRPRPRPILEPTLKWLGRAVAVLQLADIVAQSWEIGQELARETWLRDNDPDFLHPLDACLVPGACVAA